MAALGSDGSRGSTLVVLLVAVLLAAWCSWFVLARVAVREMSGAARVEVDEAVSPVAAPVAGRVVAARLELGRPVRAGDILVELDDTVERFRVDEARKQLDQATARARLAEDEQRRTVRLFRLGLVAQMDRERADTEARDRRAAAEALRAASARLDAEAGRRVIRAPVDGWLGEVTALRLGSVVREGDRLGAVVPRGTLKVIASFPARAIGRLRTGQPARVLLDGFPVTQYGHAPARVATVGSEAPDGHVRVELAFAPDRQPRLPLQHGLPATVEVEVERVSPAILVLRAAGWLAGSSPRALANGAVRTR